MINGRLFTKNYGKKTLNSSKPINILSLGGVNYPEIKTQQRNHLNTNKNDTYVSTAFQSAKILHFVREFFLRHVGLFSMLKYICFSKKI